MKPTLGGFKFFISIVGLLCSLTCTASEISSGADSEVAISRLRELKNLNQKAQKESELRQDFFDRVIFQIDSNFKIGSLHDFLAKTYAQMAERQPGSPMFDFLMQAAQLLRERQEKFENPIELTNRFLQAGGILHPMSAEQFLAEQAYSNGERSEQAHGMDRDQLGEFVDRHDLPQANGVDIQQSLIPRLKNVEIRE